MAAGSAQAQAPAQLRYQPVAQKLAYTVADTTVNTMVSPMGEMATNIYMSGAFELGSAAAGDSISVTSKLTKMEAHISAMGQEMAAPMPAGWDAESEQKISTMGTGMAATLSTSASAVAGTSMVQRLFLPLASQAIARGGSWTDSASVTMEGELTGSVDARTTATWVSDTTVDSRTLRVLRYDTDYTIKAAGQTQGMDISQEMTGKTVTTAHFDPALGMMVMVREEGELTGKMNAPAAGMNNVDMALSMRRNTQLQK